MIIQGKYGLINVVIEPQLQCSLGRTIATLQIEKHDDVLDLHQKLHGDISYSRYSWFHFTAYAALDQISNTFPGADWKSLRMHEGDISPKPVAYYYECWYERDVEAGEEENNDFFQGHILPDERDDFDCSFNEIPEAFYYYPVFKMPKELEEQVRENV